MKFAVLRDMHQVKDKVRTLNIRKVIFQLFKKLVNRTRWETALKNKGPEKSEQVFKDVFLKAQELSIPSVRNQERKARDLQR